MKADRTIRNAGHAIFMVLALLLLQACKDSSLSEHNNAPLVPDATDAQGRPIFSCSGELCFDPDDPQVTNGKQELLDLAELVWADADDKKTFFKNFGRI